MSPQEESELHGFSNMIGSRERWLLTAWVAWLIMLYVGGALIGIRHLHGARNQTTSTRTDWVRAKPDGAGTVTPTSGPGADGSVVDVTTGIRVRRVSAFDLKDAEWTADFDIWFRWSGDKVQPGETFDVANGEIQRRDKVEAYVSDGVHYERYRVSAQMIKHFDPARFPFGDEGLAIEIQNHPIESTVLQYIVDQGASGVTSNALPGEAKLKSYMVAARASRTGSGDGPSGTIEAAQSELVFVMLVSPQSTSLYLMMFQGFFVSVAVAMIVFFIRPVHVDPRFGLSVGAFFAAVTNNIFISSFLPRSNVITLAGMVNTVSLVTIFLTLVQSAMSLCIEHSWGRGRLSLVFDRVTFAVMLPCYITVNVLLPWAAMPL